MGKSFQILVSPLQPEAFVVTNVEDVHEAVENALQHCWNGFPGFFDDVPESQDCFEFKGKYLKSGYPSTEEIKWQ